MPQSPEEMAAAMLANMAEKTGKPLGAWLKVVASAQKEDPEGLTKHGQIVKYFKGEHGMTHGYASLVAHKALASDTWDRPDDDLVDAQYAGAKSGLRPIYDKLVEAVANLGDDVEVSPKKAYVSLRRSKQFAIVQPSTRTRVDLGLRLAGGVKATPPEGRLEASGGFNSMMSHRVRLESPRDVDKELLGWLKAAYTDA